jgi:hypothetical protein
MMAIAIGPSFSIPAADACNARGVRATRPREALNFENPAERFQACVDATSSIDNCKQTFAARRQPQRSKSRRRFSSRSFQQ